MAIDVSEYLSNPEFRSRFMRYVKKKQSGFWVITNRGWRYLAQKAGLVGQEFHPVVMPQKSGDPCVWSCTLHFLEDGQIRSYTDIGEATTQNVTSESAARYISVAAGRAFNRAAQAALLTGPLDGPMPQESRNDKRSVRARVEDDEDGFDEDLVDGEAFDADDEPVDEEMDEMEEVDEEDAFDDADAFDDEEESDELEDIPSDIRKLRDAIYQLAQRYDIPKADVRRHCRSICNADSPDQVVSRERLETLYSYLKNRYARAKGR